ncbi:MAG: addiction module antidote protein, HigA family [Candidatus Eremiobacter antarcticus]|nr:HigA family addiction module antidote protein [Candidatus Eremiobacteraeota bacterium]PZR62327.1 MAG: addiction module antidote protein, HigA family [Candidatus Eremiobacter sp. RRmetagenome_bin22]
MIDGRQPHSDFPIPPGEYLAEVLGEISMTQIELARRMGRPPQAINEIIRAEKMITPETALQLEHVLSVPAHVWTGLQAEYQLVLVRKQEIEALQKEVSLLKDIPYSDLAKLDLVERSGDPIQRVREIRRFFGVASLKNLELYSAAFRVGRKRAASWLATAAWLRAAELRAKAFKTERFDKAKLNAMVPKIRRLTTENIETACSKLQETLGGSGVIFLTLPHFPKTYLHGATFWLSEENAVMALTIRGAWVDIFWFSIFHEIGHILLHSKNATFVEDPNKPQTKEEVEADEYAKNVLIPRQTYQKFRAAINLSSQAIRQFAKQQAIDPAIVVGRLQHDGAIAHHVYNSLRTRLTWGGPTDRTTAAKPQRS